ncbi:MAG: rhodanese-like domain-containing protein [Spirochaetales bacterium]|nr:rhodanese-like domain-containing protein [Spirochaetales bacterium]
MKKAVILFIILTFTLLSCSAQEESDISGSLKGGLRYLAVDSGNKPLEYTVYRGDYIVLELPAGPQTFSVPDLDIEVSLPQPASEKPYVKMKESGVFPFTLGERQGTITVVELTEAHYTEFTAEEAAAFINQTEPLVLDVRTEGEYRAGHLVGASLLPVQVLTENLDKLEPYKDKDILIYCASGNRSTVASRILIDAGFTRIYNLRYGYGNWVRGGFPVE